MLILFFLYSFIFQPLASLSEDSFEIRDKTTQEIKNNLPFSILSLYLGLYSNDPEIRYRCNLILNENKLQSVILAKKLNNTKIKKILTMDQYPTKEDWKFLENIEEWLEFCEAVQYMKIHDPKKEILSRNDRELVVWIMWARAKCVRYGKDPKVGSHQMPEIIKPGQEPKNKK